MALARRLPVETMEESAAVAGATSAEAVSEGEGSPVAWNDSFAPWPAAPTLQAVGMCWRTHLAPKLEPEETTKPSCQLPGRASPLVCSQCMLAFGRDAWRSSADPQIPNRSAWASLWSSWAAQSVPVNKLKRELVGSGSAATAPGMTLAGATWANAETGAGQATQPAGPERRRAAQRVWKLGAETPELVPRHRLQTAGASEARRGAREQANSGAEFQEEPER